MPPRSPGLPGPGPGGPRAGGRTGITVVVGGFTVAMCGFFKLAEHLPKEGGPPAVDAPAPVTVTTKHVAAALVAPKPPLTWEYATAPEKMGFKVDHRPTNLFNRVQSKEVAMPFALGTHFGTKGLALTMENKTTKALEVHIPKGTFFGNTTSGVQPLIVSQDTTVHLKPGEGQTCKLDVFCGISRFKIPRDSTMEASQHVFSVPEAMKSQRALWDYMRKHYNAAPPRTTSPTSPAITASDSDAAAAERYYFSNRKQFEKFDQNNEHEWVQSGGKSKWFAEISRSGEGKAVNAPKGSSSGGDDLLKLVGDVAEVALKIALESGGSDAKQIGPGKAPSSSSASPSRQIGSGKHEK
jgi:hypothetical protein